MGHELAEQMPPGYPDVRFVPETLPILFVYDYTEQTSKALRVCSLGDLRRWIEESRRKESFLVPTLLVGLLSVAVAIGETKKRPYLSSVAQVVTARCRRNGKKGRS